MYASPSASQCSYDNILQRWYRSHCWIFRVKVTSAERQIVNAVVVNTEPRSSRQRNISHCSVFVIPCDPHCADGVVVRASISQVQHLEQNA
eukprot:2297832-Amphidinium_carterae.1